MFKIECLNAGEGDCLILHYGSPLAPDFVLVNGGAPSMGSGILKSRVAALADEYGLLFPVILELGMVTHSDSRSLEGMVGLFESVSHNTDTSLAEFKQFWHNPSMQSAPQEDRLKAELEKHGIAGNKPHGGTVGRGWGDVYMGHMKVVVIGPDTDAADSGTITALVSCQKKTILLTGDATGAELYEGLKAKDLLDGNGEAEFDVIKLPHGATAQSLDADFLGKVRAGNYIVSTDGAGAQATAGLLNALQEARGGAAFTVTLTNPIEGLDTDPNVTVVARKANEDSVLIPMA